MRVLAAAAAAILASGCAFGTNHVKLAPTQIAGTPEQGTSVRVSVKDARSEVSGAQVGFKRNGYGAKTGSVELADGEQVAARIERDLVSLLRERGYRALSIGEDTTEGTDRLTCNAEVLSFIVDVKQGFWSGSLEGLGAVRVDIIDERTGRTVWHDIVRGDYTKSGLQFVSAEDHQEVVGRMYALLISNMKSAIPDGRAPLRRPVTPGDQ